MRLDKYICSCISCSRRDAKKIIRDKKIKVNNQLIIKDDYNVLEESDKVEYNNQTLCYEKYHYYMLNKPAGFITSTKDEGSTVMELIDEFPMFNLSPVGRLDKDTEGLLLITDNGMLTHKLTSPKNHIPKTYYVELLKPLLEGDIAQLEKGIPLSDFVTQPAKVEVISPSVINLTIYEGKFHQIKRMMEYLHNRVMYLKRLSMGPIVLDEKLKLGEYKKLTSEEIQKLLDI